jgi:hypothetical protein
MCLSVQTGNVSKDICSLLDRGYTLTGDQDFHTFYPFVLFDPSFRVKLPSPDALLDYPRLTKSLAPIRNSSFEVQRHRNLNEIYHIAPGLLDGWHLLLGVAAKETRKGRVVKSFAITRT